MICRTCKKEFERKLVRGGYIDQCDRCSKGDVPRYLGRRTDKHGDVEVFRSDLSFVKKQLRLESRRGRGVNINLRGEGSVARELYASEYDLDK